MLLFTSINLKIFLKDRRYRNNTEIISQPWLISALLLIELLSHLKVVLPSFNLLINSIDAYLGLPLANYMPTPLGV